MCYLLIKLNAMKYPNKVNYYRPLTSLSPQFKICLAGTPIFWSTINGYDTRAKRLQREIKIIHNVNNNQPAWIESCNFRQHFPVNSGWQTFTSAVAAAGETNWRNHANRFVLHWWYSFEQILHMASLIGACMQQSYLWIV